MSEQLAESVVRELEDRGIPVGDRILRDRFDELSPVAQMAVVKAGIVVFDGPQPNNPRAIPRERFNAYTEAEQRRLRDAGYFVVG
jgi:hypothetical protein